MAFDPTTATPVVQEPGAAPAAPSGFDPSSAQPVTQTSMYDETPSSTDVGDSSAPKKQPTLKDLSDFDHKYDLLTMGSDFLGEPLLHAASGVAGGIAADVTGLGKDIVNYITGGTAQNADELKAKVQNAVTTEPRTPAGQLGEKVVDTVLAPVGKVINYGENKIGDLASWIAGKSGADQNTQDLVKSGTQNSADLALNFLPGKALKTAGKVAEPVLDTAADAAQKTAGESAFKAAGGTLAAANKLAKTGKSSADLGNWLLDKDVVTPLGTNAGMTEKLGAVGDSANATLGQLHDVLDANNISEVHPADLLAEINGMKYDNPAKGSVQAAANKHIDTILDIVQKYGEDVDPNLQTPIPLNQARALRQEIDANTNFNTIGDVAAKVKNKAGRNAREAVKGAIQKTVEGDDATSLLSNADWQAETQPGREMFVRTGQPGLTDAEVTQHASIANPLSPDTMDALTEMARKNNPAKSIDVNDIPGLSAAEKAPSQSINVENARSGSINAANPFDADIDHLMDSFKNANKDVSNTIEAQKLLKRQENAGAGNNKIGLGGTIFGAAGGGIGTAIGGPLGAAIGGAAGIGLGKLKDAFGASTNAALMDKLAGGLRGGSRIAGKLGDMNGAQAASVGTAVNQGGQTANRDQMNDYIPRVKEILAAKPQLFGKYAKPLADAASRGDDKLAATMYMLGTTDPEYRALVKDVADPNLDQ